MGKFRIKVMNNIVTEGLALFGNRYRVNPDETDPHGIIVRSSRVNIDKYPNLLAVARAGAGVNNIPVERASERGICVFNTPGANANAVVELVFTMLGIWLRHAHQGIAFCQSLAGLKGDDLNRTVEQQKKKYKGEEMTGKTLGVIGLGKIGVGTANTGVYHQMRVIGFDPFPVMDNIHDLSPDVELARSRAEVLTQSDYVSLHVPLNKNTQGLVSSEFLNKMKPGALLLNYARGPVVDEDAVLQALAGGQLGGYITDFPSEKIIGHDKILISPHLGASTTESEENCATMAVRELKGYLEYGNITHSVNFPNVESIRTVKVDTRLIMINRDEPGMIGAVTNILGKHKINIMSYDNKSNGTIGYNIIDCAGPVSRAVQKEIEEKDGVINTRIIPLAK
ncbi:MAG: 3-phosphoglycerate dehydrogenase family protein [Desulfobulbaceae bacterium]|nr:3-phosphoglycerate dehydrogenase family protein [Desulfobulbaceae bacterium]